LGGNGLGIETSQTLFQPIFFICLHGENTCLRQLSRGCTGGKKCAKNTCCIKGARTGGAVDCVALMPRIDDVGDIKPSAGLAHDAH